MVRQLVYWDTPPSDAVLVYAPGVAGVCHPSSGDYDRRHRYVKVSGQGLPDMQRFLWLRADDAVGPWTVREPLIEAAADLGVDGVLVDASDAHRVRQRFDGTILAFHDGDDAAVLDVSEAEPPQIDVTVVGKGSEGDGTRDRPSAPETSGDLALLDDLDGETAAYVTVDGEAATDLATWAASVADHVILHRTDWEIIPLENLIAEAGGAASVVPVVDGPEGARTAVETLETGADGVVLETDDPGVVAATVDELDRTGGPSLELTWARVVDTEPAGLADRVCIDTGSMLEPDEGMLVGSHARGLAFVHAETADGPYTDPRPFRVNAGAVHAYVLVPDGRTKYLAEVRAGDRVVVVDTGGSTREAVVGRAKIERRPMRRVSLETDSGDVVELLLQEAETVRLHTHDRGAVAVTELAAGDEVALRYEDVARHFGTPVDEETLIER